MNTIEFRRLQKSLQQRLRHEKLKPHQLDPDTIERIKANWGSVVKAAEEVDMPNSTLYKWLRQGWVPAHKSFTVSYLLEHSKKEN